MGACGCIGINYPFKEELADGRILLVGVYPSCRYCDSPAGVLFWAVSKQDFQDWHQRAKPLLDGQEMTAIPVADPRFIREAMTKALTGVKPDEGDCIDEVLAEVIAEETFPELRDVVSKTEEEHGG